MLKFGIFMHELFSILLSIRPLYYVGMEIFNEFQIPDVLCIEESVLKSWLKVWALT